MSVRKVTDFVDRHYIYCLPGIRQFPNSLGKFFVGIYKNSKRYIFYTSISKFIFSEDFKGLCRLTVRFARPGFAGDAAGRPPASAMPLSGPASFLRNARSYAAGTPGTGVVD
jgi:hypothetical protein